MSVADNSEYKDLSAFLAFCKYVDHTLVLLEKVLSYCDGDGSGAASSSIVKFVDVNVGMAKDLLSNVPSYEDMRCSLSTFEKANCEERRRSSEQFLEYERVCNELSQEKKMWKLFLVDEMFESVQEKWQNIVNGDTNGDIFDLSTERDENSIREVVDVLSSTVANFDQCCKRLYWTNIHQYSVNINLQKRLDIADLGRKNGEEIQEKEISPSCYISELETEASILRSNNKILSEKVDEILSEEMKDKSLSIVLSYVGDFANDLVEIIKEKNRCCKQLEQDLERSEMCGDKISEKYQESVSLISRLIQHFQLDVSSVRSQFQDLKMGDTIEKSKKHRAINTRLRNNLAAKEELVVQYDNKEKEFILALESSKRDNETYFMKLKNKMDAKTCEISRLQCQLRQSNDKILQLSRRFENEADVRIVEDKEKLYVYEKNERSQVQITYQRKMIANMKYRLRAMKRVKLYKRRRNCRNARITRLYSKLVDKTSAESLRNLGRQNMNLLFVIRQYEEVLSGFRKKMCLIISILHVEMGDRGQRDNDRLGNKTSVGTMTADGC